MFKRGQLSGLRYLQEKFEDQCFNVVPLFFKNGTLTPFRNSAGRKFAFFACSLASASRDFYGATVKLNEGRTSCAVIFSLALSSKLELACIQNGFIFKNLNDILA